MTDSRAKVKRNVGRYNSKILGAKTPERKEAEQLGAYMKAELRRFRKSGSPEEAKQLLVKAGILKSDGSLSAHYKAS